jgi:hypothetical protein
MGLMILHKFNLSSKPSEGNLCRAEAIVVEGTEKALSMPRELIEPHKDDKRYVRRGKRGKFTSSQVKVRRSLSADRRSKAKTVVKKGEGDRGDRRSD